MQLDYTNYKQNYPSTLALIEDVYHGLGIKESNLNEEDKYRIVTKLIEDEGDNLDRGTHEKLSSWEAHFMRKPDEVTVEVYRRTLMESIYKNYEPAIKEMFGAIANEHERELREIRRTRFYVPTEKYLDDRDRAYAVNHA